MARSGRDPRSTARDPTRLSPSTSAPRCTAPSSTSAGAGRSRSHLLGSSSWRSRHGPQFGPPVLYGVTTSVQGPSDLRHGHSRAQELAQHFILILSPGPGGDLQVNRRRWFSTRASGTGARRGYEVAVLTPGSPEGDHAILQPLINQGPPPPLPLRATRNALSSLPSRSLRCSTRPAPMSSFRWSSKWTCSPPERTHG